MAPSSTVSTLPEPRQFQFKILVTGDVGVGGFSTDYRLTIGVDFSLKNIEWNESTNVNLQLWDIAGHERFGNMTAVYYRHASAAIIVFDPTRPHTFKSVSRWYEDLISKFSEDGIRWEIPVLLLANKCDLPYAKIDFEEVHEFCEEHGFVGWFPTSAKENINIDSAMMYLVEKILKNKLDGCSPESKQSRINLAEEVEEDTVKKKKCC
ncbi:ras-related protein Rab-32B isoform X2 [Lingula anatina]|uniref:Ras-related protein Rab n=1 Tax=Lingula anatina TaxID=7574 RepID=A0A1S3JBY0_LINAN|nr:ras-related protein Rab-32B isoform X2 [Lingula anatina]|eukprot:XP_013407691.1 ras-related protein Rab-32B isoform X2 [Lingula anatina]